MIYFRIVWTEFHSEKKPEIFLLIMVQLIKKFENKITGS